MKEMTDKAIRLGIIGAVAALLLAMVNNITEPLIAERRALELTEALTVLAVNGTPGAAEIEPAPGVTQRWPIKGGRGWILELRGTGYGGPMTIVASYDIDGSVMVARLMDNNETVGFGKKAENPGYMKIFVGTGGERTVPRTKADLGSDAYTVSGATVTFACITEALRTGSDLVKEWEGR